MTIEISFKEALQIWESQYATPETLWPHPSDAELDLDNLQDPVRRREVVDHIACCGFCADRYRDRSAPSVTSALEGWDVAVRKAAAGTAPSFPAVYHTSQGHYRIEILQNSTGSDDGLIILTILDAGAAAKYENRTLRVCDAQGRLLLCAAIKDGQTWQQISKLAEIDAQSFLVHSIDSLDQQ
jgi:hypothetical protein